MTTTSLSRRELNTLKGMAYEGGRGTGTEVARASSQHRQGAVATLRRLAEKGLVRVTEEDRWKVFGKGDTAGERLVPVRVYVLTTAGYAAAPQYGASL